MALNCQQGKTNIAAQTLFLGASVADFNVSMGWGGRPSQLSVKLIEDRNPFCIDANGTRINAFPSASSYANDHYHTCATDEDCFIDETGAQYDATKDPPSKDKIVPGKVYYVWTAANGFVSKYWTDPDPGFFGNKTCFTNAGVYNIDSYNDSKGFDIINTPVMFRVGNFSFTGLVQSWERNYDNGGLTYDVIIESVDSILDQCHMILDKYSGAIFGKLSTNTYGGPSNYTGSALTYSGTIKQGNIPNVFNVYGFLESMGLGKFGGSNKNENGIPAADIADAIQILTSSVSANADPAFSLNQLSKRAFSPYGRILLKVPQANESYLRVTSTFTNTYGFGLLPITQDSSNIERCHFSLDLSELPALPYDYRISESSMSILSFIQQVTQATGTDFYFDIIPATISNMSTNIIKLRTIFRSAQPDPRQIEKTIKNFEDGGIPISAARIGKEKNSNTGRVLYIGANQQRLYQAKTYRLAYAQSDYIYDAISGQFVEYYSTIAGSADASNFGKIREPSFFSTRNTAYVRAINNSSNYNDLFAMDESVHNTVNSTSFHDDSAAQTPTFTMDADWSDTNLASNTRAGNYKKTAKYTKSLTQNALPSRFFPLGSDIISPFFGYKMEEDISIQNTNSLENVIRRVRPVWMDSWTGQILILMDLSELPKTLSVSLESLYSSNLNPSTMFVITESEIRAALSSNGFDSFLTYSLGKTFKPDLLVMLTLAYIATGKLVVEDENDMFATSYAPGAQGNAANTAGLGSGPAKPAQNYLDLNANLFLSPNFLKDMNEIFKFVVSIGQKHYGKDYLVRLPDLYSYKDQQYIDVQVPGESTAMYAYQGTGKIYYQYDIATDGAWEEFGNMIDDNIIVGSPDWYAITDDEGKIQPLLGFNASDSYDRINKALCDFADDVISNNGYGYEEYSMLDAVTIARSGDCNNPYNFTYPSIDIGGLSESDYIVKNSPVEHPDQFGNLRDMGESSKRLYYKASVDSELAFMDPDNLRDPRAIISINNEIQLRTASKLYSMDPNRTVLTNICMEDLCIYLRSDPINSIEDDFASVMLHRITKVFGNSSLLRLAESNEHAKFHTMAPKVAHPYFAAIPIKSNQYCYGPWTNYPQIDKSIIFPDAPNDIARDNAVENLVGGTKVEIKEDFAPWKYGGMGFLDQAALTQIYNDVQYQQIMETASLSIPGLPIFGLGSSFNYDNTAKPANSIGYNGQYYTPTLVSISFDDKKMNPPLSAGLDRSVNPIYIPAIDEPTITTTKLTYQYIKLVPAKTSSVAPIVSDIRCNISPQNVGTTYSFRTYMQRLGFFNKENSERIKQNGLNIIKTNKKFNDIITSFNNKIAKDRLNLSDQLDQKTYKAEQFESGFFGTSPSILLIGSSGPFVYPPTNTRSVISNQVRGLMDVKNSPPTEDPSTNSDGNNNANAQADAQQSPFQTILRGGQDLGETEIRNKFASQPVLGLLKDMRWRTFVGSFTEKDTLSEIAPSYDTKAVMSLDGIFSPVSFYPTHNLSCYALTKYVRSQCPECKGSGVINIQILDFSTRQKTQKEYSCPYCTIKKDVIGSSSTRSSSSSESLPPYIITNSNDFNTILSFKKSSNRIGSSIESSSSNASKKSGLDIPVNMVSLQPVVVPYGEFRNFNVQNSGDSVDRCRHSIEVVGRGKVPPSRNHAININNNLKTLYDKDNGKMVKFNVNGSGVNADFYAFDLLTQNDRNSNNARYPMNQRFFGIRGPMIMHGWGYDTQGYPVPNASDEPLVEDDFGRVARFNIKIEYESSAVNYKDLNNGDTFVLTTPTTNNELIYFVKRPGIQVLSSGEWIFPSDDLQVTKVEVSNDLDGTPASGSLGSDAYKNLGDIITKQYEHDGTKWTLKERSRQFYLNWAERPDLWPVGPIDLRWDSDRKVWTINPGASTYKFVYITLEEDLVKEQDFDETYPTKGYIDDIEYSKDPLPKGYRRLVYVKDKTGYTAPRGIKLLCRYNVDTGFYEPISKPSVVAKGVIDSGDMVKLDMDYAQGNRSGSIPILNTSFVNPLGFATTQGSKGIFTYIQGAWTLTSIK